MTRVLVTGATSPVGCHLVRALLARPGIDHVLAQGANDEPCGLDSMPAERLTYRKVDMSRAREVRTLLYGPVRDLGIDVVVHTPLDGGARAHGGKVHRLNVESTRSILAFAESHPTVRRFVYRSSADVYRIDPGEPTMVGEAHPLALSPSAPQRVRDRLEADITVCTRMGLAPMSIAVLRLAEILAPGCSSQLHDYLRSRVCLRPLGFDPMLNVLSLDDAVRAMVLAVESDARGVFNVPGADTLPLSEAVRLWGRMSIPLPGPVLAPLYEWRAGVLGMQFRYDMNYRRFHFSAVLDGTRARKVLGYEPLVPIRWPTGVRLPPPSNGEVVAGPWTVPPPPHPGDEDTSWLFPTQ